MNERIKNAIEVAVAAEQQPPELSQKIVAWMENLIDGNEDIADLSAYARRCGLCFETTILQPIKGE